MGSILNVLKSYKSLKLKCNRTSSTPRRAAAQLLQYHANIVHGYYYGTSSGHSFWVAALLLRPQKSGSKKFTYQKVLMERNSTSGDREPGSSSLFSNVQFNSRGRSKTANATKKMGFVIFWCQMINVDSRKILVCIFWHTEYSKR